jgi:uncharacterized membrane protein YqjE
MRDLTDAPAKDDREPYPVDEPDTSLGELAGRLTGEMGALLTDHLQLARVEIIEDLKKAGRGVGFLGAGAMAGWLAALLLSMAAAWGLADFVDTWLAFLIVGAVWAIVAAVTATSGKKQLEDVDPVPAETMNELEKDKQWISEQTT